MAENGLAVEGLTDFECGFGGIEGADYAAEGAEGTEGVERVGGIEGAADGGEVWGGED